MATSARRRQTVAHVLAPFLPTILGAVMVVDGLSRLFSDRSALPRAATLLVTCATVAALAAVGLISRSARSGATTPRE